MEFYKRTVGKLGPDMMSGNRRWLIAISVFTGAVMGTIDTFILYIAAPQLRGIFSATIGEISWVSTSYAASSLVSMLLSSWMCSRYGTKTVYLIMLAVFVLSSVLCGMSENLSQLIFSRTIQGAAAGMLLPIENVVLRQAFPKSEHGSVLGIYAATIMLGPSLGPLMGGYIIDNFHWSIIFYINVPIGIVGFLMASWFIPSDIQQGPADNRRLDLPGVGLAIVGIFSLVWLLERGDRLDWFDDPTNLCLGWLSAFCLAMFCAHEMSVSNPMVDLSVLRFRQYRICLVLKFLVSFVVSATLFALPIYMQELLEFSATKAGLSMAPRALVMMILFPIVGMLIKRLNPRIFFMIGGVIGAYGAFLMTRFTHDTGIGDMYIPQILQGMATVLILMPLTTIGLMSVSPDKLAAASGLDACVRVLGGILGIAVFVALISHYQETTWGMFRDDITFSKTELFRRFSQLVDGWVDSGSSIPEAVQRGGVMLYGRINQQVAAVTYMRIFQDIMWIFMLVLLVLSALKIKKAS